MSRPEADPRIPFPHTDARLACRKNPGWFVHEYGQSSSKADRERIEQARQACRRCPIAADCLKWALANPELTPTGIWAATVSRERKALRRRLQERHGLDWVGVVAAADRAREQARLNRARPPAPDPAPAASAMWTSHYEPWREPLTPDRQQRNRELLNQT
ncbi:WhiB family transcriptional regulator [Streptomyces tauricus]|uniref:WhiB family transcriptional regulator n=1 Tax=Streptomyces tauricus TaxID=68274 RepID=UPI002243AFA6|nr:WhiB family transcriptional regulator [Streptomyces tauricus]MCW8102690.1 WhiB family transcriptional regulator [Streptomyces tauricus]